MFNEGRYVERVQSGELVELLGFDHHPCPPGVNEPFCTRSQRVRYVDLQRGGTVAQVHQYLRMDGSLGASGRPDPKAILQGRTIYRLELDEPDSL